MDKLKTILNKDKESPEASNPTGPTGKMTGQGSHFPHGDELAGGNTAGGDGAGESLVTGTDARSGDSTGTAAIGSTSTYSSHPLRKGEGLGSVVDHSSTDPTTYKTPEHTFREGVPPGAAEVAASQAFGNNRGHSVSDIPGAYPKDQSTTAQDTAGAGNTAPTGTTEFGGGVGSSRMEDPTTAHNSSRTGEAALAGAAGIGAGGVGGADSRPVAPSSSDYNQTSTAPSTLTTTEPPADRSAEYGRAENTKVPETQTSTLGRLLGAVGLGSMAGATVVNAADEHEKEQPLASTHDQPTTTTGTDSYTAPTRSEPTHGHYRKESIPTTAYPAGQASPSPISAPVGGTSAAADEEEKHHYGRDAGIAATGLGAGGAAGYGLHEHERSREPQEPDFSDRTTSYTAPPTTQSTTIPDSRQESSTFRRDDYESTVPVEKEQSHAGRDTAALGAGGAAAYGAHEYERSREPRDITSSDRSEPSKPSTMFSSSTYAPTSSTYEPTSSNYEPTSSTYEPRQDTSTMRRDANEPAAASDRDDSHAGRNAAFAGAAGTGAGVAGYEAYKYEHQPQPSEQATGYYSSPTESHHPTTHTKTPTTREEPPISKKESAHTAAPITAPTSQKVAESRHTTEPEEQESHTGRNAALAGAAGGAAAYGVHEHNQHQSQEESARLEDLRQKELAEQEAARQKQYEKDQKLAEKQAAKEEKQYEKDLKKEKKAEEKAAVKEEKEHQKELEKEEKHHQKQREEEEAAAAAAAAKEEKKHEKMVAKEEKQHEKELGKERKAEEAAALKQDKQHQHELEKEERRRREKEAALGATAVGGAAAGGAAYEAHEHDKPSGLYQQDQGLVNRPVERGDQPTAADPRDPSLREQEGLNTAYAVGSAGAAGKAPEDISRHDTTRPPHDTTSAGTTIGAGTTAGAAAATGQEEHERNRLHKDPPEKKPNIFKRIFKRRKNKDTGEDEDYSTDEDEGGHHAHHGHHTAGAGAVGATGAGAYAADERLHHEGQHSATGTDTQTAGFQKPSYNPLHKDKGMTTSTPQDRFTTAPTGAAEGRTSTGTQETTRDQPKEGLVHRLKEQFKPLPEPTHEEQTVQQGGGLPTSQYPTK